MDVIKTGQFLRIIAINGTVEVLGPWRDTGTTDFGTEKFKGPHRYEYIRVLDKDTGNPVTIRDVSAHENCDSYLRPGLEARFFFGDAVDSRAKPNCLLGLRVGNRDVDDMESVSDSMRMFSLMRKKIDRYMILFIVAGGLVSLTIVGAIIGLPMFLIGWWTLRKSRKLNEVAVRIVAEIPAEAEFRSMAFGSAVA